ncbi:phospholipase D-like domain-containing protein [Cryobacterium tepidiphilum]|uniref:Phosphatidylserine/phosphatidylglycerophosphate/ cardiolipin synthase family protein n=1 Tax=Cryobacterium tepidiphilum TaxID=2486026 RepID=A0A3M8LI64_9MICO|nr:phospholipase D-like domain-containing protein [Cryobacterium tepidiphilum]RNE64188.1 phosphatidylserine/phosphatidylglycerophosphate/cardiolipin synthase family protein [Cryobacterium tepidiphilum]
MSQHAVHRLKHLLFTLVKRGILAFFAVQATVIATLVTIDTVTRHRRVKRTRFPHPGTFQSQVARADMRLYTFGEDLYRDMLHEIETAEHLVLLETYIWKNDEVGQKFLDAVNGAARRGVDVYVIYDGFANLVVPPAFYDFHPSVHVLRFPVFRASILFTNVRGTGFDHRKVLVVDDRVGFVGGYNIGSLYATQWRDTHLKIMGPSVWDLRQAFANMWNSNRKTGWGRATRAILPEISANFWEPRIRAVNNIPSNLVFPTRGVYLDAINRASRHIFITTPYFIPDQQILDAILAAARRGVDVRVLIPETSNHVLADWLSRGFYTDLLKADVSLLLYENAMIHAKTATIDGEWSIVGTANLDRLSLTGNYEIGMEIYDTDLAGDLERIFEIDSSNCRELTLKEWGSRHVAARFSEAVLAPLRPLL